MKALTIFLADDDDDDRDFFKIALKKSGIECELVECQDGEKLLKHLKKHPLPEFIFLDINMPKINGIECLSELQRLKEIEKTKIVMLSTAASPIVIDNCCASGAWAYIIKPDTTGALEVMISYCVKSLTEKRHRHNFVLNNSVKEKRTAR